MLGKLHGFFGGFNDSPRTLHSTENTAFFAQVDYDLSDKMTLTLLVAVGLMKKNLCVRSLQHQLVMQLEQKHFMLIGLEKKLMV